MTLPIVLVIAALLVLVLEVFFVSFGVLSIVAVTLAVFGVVLGFRESNVLGWSLIGVMVVGGPLVLRGAFKILPRLPFGRSFQLSPPAARPQAAPSAAAQTLLGAVGEAASPLRPSGRAFFDGRPVDVVTRGPMLQRGTRIKVVEITGNRIFVEAIK